METLEELVLATATIQPDSKGAEGKDKSIKKVIDFLSSQGG